jgi:hypothetical protein
MSETTILSEVKETLDFAVAEDDGFDDRLLLELDGLIGELSQLTYVKEDFVLTKDSKYEQLLKKNDPNLLRLVKTFINLSLRLVFDPPVGSVLTSLEKSRDRTAVRITMQKERYNSYEP